MIFIVEVMIFIVKSFVCLSICLSNVLFRQEIWQQLSLIIIVSTFVWWSKKTKQTISIEIWTSSLCAQVFLLSQQKWV